jgi:hypothetical protein
VALAHRLPHCASRHAPNSRLTFLPLPRILVFHIIWREGVGGGGRWLRVGGAGAGVGRAGVAGAVMSESLREGGRGQCGDQRAARRPRNGSEGPYSTPWRGRAAAVTEPRPGAARQRLPRRLHDPKPSGSREMGSEPGGAGARGAGGAGRAAGGTPQTGMPLALTCTSIMAPNRSKLCRRSSSSTHHLRGGGVAGVAAARRQERLHLDAQGPRRPYTPAPTLPPPHAPRPCTGAPRCRLPERAPLKAPGVPHPMFPMNTRR